MELALANGFRINRSKGLKWPVMDHANGDRIIIVNPGNSGNQGYFNPKDDRDRGTIVQFVKNRLGGIFPMDTSITPAQNVNKVLCSWLNLPFTERLAFQKTALPSRHGSKVTEFQFNPSDLRPLSDHSYLLSRGILPETFNHVSFRGQILSSISYGGTTVAFPYRQSPGGKIVGAEARGVNLKRHLTGSRKASSVWISNPPAFTGRLIICESAIDCLSYHQLKGAGDNLYVSFGGTLANGQMECIKGIISSIEKSDDFRILIAVDNDEAGKSYAALLQNSFSEAILDRPSIGKDFSDEMQLAYVSKSENLI